MANKIGAAKYFECCSITDNGVRDVFEAAAKLLPFDVKQKKSGRLKKRLFGR